MSHPSAAAARHSASRDGAWIDRLAIVMLALLVQVPGLLHWIDSDPLLVISQLRQGGLPGLLPGMPGWIDPNIGVTTQTLGHLAAESWLAGQVPWWNPYSGIGVPLAAEMQPAALFLPFVLLLHFADGLLWLRLAMQAVSGLATYELLRALGLRRSACFAGGLLFAFNGTLAWLPHGPERAAAFLPLVLLGVERCRQRAGRALPLGWLWLATGLAYSLYAGFPETAFLDGLFAGVWAAWRLATASGARVRLLAKLAAGTITGLLLAAPLIWPFLDYLGRSEVGPHANAFAHVKLVANTFPMFLLPYVYGPICSVGCHPNGPTWYAWGNIGGYVGAAAAALGLSGLLGAAGSGGRERGLRLVLGLWIALSLAKSANLPGVTEAFNLVPMIVQTAVFRYAEPSWSLAAVVLAALAIDDWQRPRPVAGVLRVCAMLAGAAGLLLLAAALRLAWPTMRQLAVFPGYVAFAACMVGWCALLMIGLPLLLGGPPARGRLAAMLVLVGMDAVGMFALPLLSATRGATLDRAPLDFLRDHLGLQRFYSLGVIPPNYGALFGLASINADMLPVPEVWARDVRDALDPLATPTTFAGIAGGRPPGPSPQQMLRDHADAYRDLAVRYVVTPHGAGSLVAMLPTDPPDADVSRLSFAPGDTVSGRLPPDFAQGKQITGVSVKLGTYAGQARGRLDVALCAGDRCSRGAVALRDVLESVGAEMRLDTPLSTRSGDALSFSLHRGDGQGRLALWLFRGSAAHLDLGTPPGFGPGLGLSYEDPRAWPRVFDDRHVEIVALPDPAPYFSAAPPCALVVDGRTDLAATCPAPAILTRRELAFPGWRAAIDGRTVPLGTKGIVQTVTLPVGRSRIHFAYAPPHIAVAWAAAATGLAWGLLATGWARWRQVRLTRRVRRRVAGPGPAVLP